MRDEMPGGAPHGTDSARGLMSLVLSEVVHRHEHSLKTSRGVIRARGSGAARSQPQRARSCRLIDSLRA